MSMMENIILWFLVVVEQYLVDDRGQKDRTTEKKYKKKKMKDATFDKVDKVSNETSFTFSHQIKPCRNVYRWDVPLHSRYSFSGEKRSKKSN